MNLTDTITLARVYAVVRDALDYSGRLWTDKEVKAFVDTALSLPAKDAETEDALQVKSIWHDPEAT